MGGCKSKQERRSVRSVKEETLRYKEWRKERKKLRDEVKRLRKKVEKEREYWKWVVEEMYMEKAVRDESMEKWKQLYLSIKHELDHLIIHHTTSFSSGESVVMQRKLKDEEAMKTMEELRDEVRAKEDTIKMLKERIALMDRQKYEKEREVDLLRQSLRILGSKKKNKKIMNLLVLKTKCV